jgi:hypothetical protein
MAHTAELTKSESMSIASLLQLDISVPRRLAARAKVMLERRVRPGKLAYNLVYQSHVALERDKTRT